MKTRVAPAGISLLFLTLTACATASGQEASVLNPCTADAQTGLCFPEEKNLDDVFPEEKEQMFWERVREDRVRQSSSSSTLSSASRFSRFFGARRSLSSSSLSYSSVFFPSRGKTSDFSTVVVSADGNPSVRSQNFRSASQSDDSVRSGGVPSQRFDNESNSEDLTDDDSVSEDFSDTPSFDGQDALASHGPGQSPTDSRISGERNEEGGPQIRGSLGPLPSGTCRRDRSLIALFDPAIVTTGRGWTFPVLIAGDCPASAAVLNPDAEGFGGSLDF